MQRLTFKTHEDARHLQSLDTPIWVFDVANHGIWWANRKGLSFWNARTLDELTSRDFSSDGDIVRKRLRQVLAAGNGGTTQENWTLYPCGRPVNALLSFQPVILGDGVDGVLIEVRRVESGLSDADSWRMLEATRATSLMVSTFSAAGDLLAQNPAAAACYGHGTDGSGAKLSSRLPSGTSAQATLERILSDENPSWEVPLQTVTGLRTHLVSARRGRDPITGEFVAVLAAEDITELADLRHRQITTNRILEGKIAESTDKLRDSEERFALVVESAAIWDWNVKRDKLFVSPSLIRELGYEQDRFLEILRDSHLAGFMSADDAASFSRIVQQHLAQPDKPIVHELRFRTAGGDYRWYQAQGRFLCDDTGQPIRAVGLLTDVTERKTLEASLLAAQRMEAIGQLTGGIAHDFNNLLTVIQGNAQLLQELDSTDAELTTEIVRAVQRGAEMTRRLLAFARKQVLMPQAVDLATVIQGMRNSVLRAIGENIHLEMTLPTGLWSVYADPAQVESAVLNVALNARDAMINGGHLTISCQNRCIGPDRDNGDLEVAPGRYVEIAISDNGMGMSPEILSKACEPFYTSKTVGQGSGLGLPMVLGFTRQSGGDTRIDSDPGHGTCVRMYLPIAMEGPEPETPRRNLRMALGAGELVHVVEDNLNVQHTLTRTLRSLGYTVSATTTAKAALQAAKGHPKPRLYLVDIMLPGGCSGVDFAREIRNRDPESKVILVSGLSSSELANGKLEGVAQAFLFKPIDKAHLSQVVRSVLMTERAFV